MVLRLALPLEESSIPRMPELWPPCLASCTFFFLACPLKSSPLVTPQTLLQTTCIAHPSLANTTGMCHLDSRQPVSCMTCATPCQLDLASFPSFYLASCHRMLPHSQTLTHTSPLPFYSLTRSILVYTPPHLASANRGTTYANIAQSSALSCVCVPSHQVSLIPIQG
jgi:hypothetical protein